MRKPDFFSQTICFDIENPIAIQTLRMLGKILPIEYTELKPDSPNSNNNLWKHYEKILPKPIWRSFLPYMNYSYIDNFRRILSKFRELAAKKQLRKIDLLDIVFLTGNYYLIVAQLRNLNIPINQELIDKAVLCNNVSTLLALEQQGLIINNRILEPAAENGCLDILKFLITRDILPTKDTLDAAAFRGQVNALQFLIEERNIKPTINTLDLCIIGGELKPHKNRVASQYLRSVMPEFQTNNITPKG